MKENKREKNERMTCVKKKKKNLLFYTCYLRFPKTFKNIPLIDT